MISIVFYTPMVKPPYDDSEGAPSGDKLMHRQLGWLFEGLGYEECGGSGLHTYSSVPDPVRLASLLAKAQTELARFRADYIAGPRLPDAWITYHPYYKAPDLIGPAICATYGIPYVTIEGSYAPKRDLDEWAPWQRHTATALRQARVNICFTERDAAGIAALPGRKGRIALMTPFVYSDPFATATKRLERGSRPLRLVTVAMMRPGDKLASYRVLAKALGLVAERSWHLTIVGDGPARAEVEHAFANVSPDRITWRGKLDGRGVNDALINSDVLVWPGIGEAYGLAYLEAASHCVPAVALDIAGVSAVVADGESGLLAPARGELDDFALSFATALVRLLDDPALTARLGTGARDRLFSVHSPAQAAARLAPILAEITLRRDRTE